MFSNINLVNSKTLGSAWKLAHDMHIGNTEKVNLPNICEELNSLVTSVSVKTDRRLSLRAASNLIGGTAKLYRHSLDKLFDDVMKMNEDLLYRRKRYRRNSSFSESSASTETTVEEPEATRSATVDFMNSSFSPTKRIRTGQIMKIAPRITMSRFSSDKITTYGTNSNEDTNHNECTSDTEKMGNTGKMGTAGYLGNGVEETFSEEENSENQRKNEGIQTSPILGRKNRENKDNNMENRYSITGNSNTNRENRGTNTNSEHTGHVFDRNLPFGYILIHDSYDSRIPSRIMFTSISSDVNNLI